MLEDIPYDTLKEDNRAYDIMLLRDQKGISFAAISKKFSISANRVVQIYNKQKTTQIHLYLRHIAVALGQETTTEIRKVYRQALDCYQDRVYACAYLEREYGDILTPYRQGEPGASQELIRSLPPLKPQLGQETVARIVEMREVESASFAQIARELDITRAKARHTYDWYYRQRVTELVQPLMDQARTQEERWEIWNRYLRNNASPKWQYEMLANGLEKG